MPLRHPRLPSHWLSWVDPPDEGGLETLHLATAGRRVTVEGEFLRELWRDVLPLLDGAHDFEEFTAQGPLLDELCEAGVLAEGAAAQKWNGLQEWGVAPEAAEATLRQARVAVIGAGPIADHAAAALRDLGCELERFPEERVALAICASDAMREQLAVQKAAWAARTPVLFCSANACEVVLGPLAIPGETACILCGHSRALGCAGDPSLELERLRQLELQARPDASARETLPAAAALLGQMVGIEALQFLLGEKPATAGALRVIALPGFASGLHSIAPLPRCPICGGEGRSPRHLRDLVSDRVGLVRAVSMSGTIPKICTALLAHAEAEAALAADRVAIAAAADESAALDAAVAHALAFRCAMQLAPERIGKAEELDGRAILPPELVLFSEEQRKARSCRGHRYRPDAEIGWTRAIELGSGEPVWVPRHLVQLGDLQPRRDEDFCRPTASGLRSGASFAEAAEEAALDLVAHDAFLLTWMLRLAPAEVGEAEISPAACLGIESMRAQAADVHLRELPTDAPAHVVVAIAASQNGPAAVVEVAAHPSLATAAERAVNRLVAARYHERLRFAEGERIAPEQVVLEEDHALLFHDAQHARELSFLLEAGADRRPVAARDLIAGLRELDVRLFAVDLTTSETRAAGLHVARVLATRLQPLHSGHLQERLGGDRVARRVRDLPGAGRSELNRFPHPLAVGPRLSRFTP